MIKSKKPLILLLLFLLGGTVFEYLSWAILSPGVDALRFIFWGVIYLLSQIFYRKFIHGAWVVNFVFAFFSIYFCLVVSVVGIGLIPFAVETWPIFIFAGCVSQAVSECIFRFIR